MKIVIEDIFEAFNEGDILLTTTNNVVKSNGELVMEAGSAKAFSKMAPTLPKILGQHVKENGNIPCLGNLFVINNKECMIGSFPTKNHYKDKSDLELIINSAKILSKYIDKVKPKCVRITAPGIGLGGLDWEKVKNAIEPYLDDRVVIHFKEDKKINNIKVIPKSLAIIIAGSRNFNDYNTLESTCDYMLSKKIKEGYSITVISGTANGADKLGELYATNRGFNLIRMPADWSIGKRAGYLRNEQMALKVLEYEFPCCICFRVNNSKGTSHMIDLCKKYKVNLYIRDF